MLPTPKDPLPSRLPPEKKGEATDQNEPPARAEARQEVFESLSAVPARESSRAAVGDRFLPTIEALPDNLFGKVQFSRKPFWVHMREKFSWCLATVKTAEKNAATVSLLAAITPFDRQG